MHLMYNEACHRLVIGEVPPIPAEVLPASTIALPDGQHVSRRSNRLLLEEPEFNLFPDDLSAINTLPTPHERSPADCCLPPHAIFQLPSELIQKVQNLGLNLDDSSFGDDTPEELEELHNDGMNLPDSLVIVPPPLLVTEVPPSTGYNLGEIFSIAPDEDFDMLQAFPSSLISMTRIIHYCRKAAVPLYLVDGILKIVSEEVGLKRLNLNAIPCQRSVMKDLSRLFHVPSPLPINIPLERTVMEQQNGEFPRSSSFPTFSFLEQLQDLLSMSDIFSDIGNLVVNPDDPWLPYKRSGSYVDEMQDAEWFLNAQNPDPNPIYFDLGLLLYTDKTGKGALNPHGMEPIVFTLTMLREAVRQRPECWRPLGFIPQFRKSSSALERVQKQSKRTSGRLVRNYHLVLDALLSGIVECQKNPPIVRMRIGNEWKFVMVRIFLEAVLGDALSNDVICGRVQSRNSSSMRLCRACHIPQVVSDDSAHCCKYLIQKHMERIIISALGPESDISNPGYQNKWEAFVDEMIVNTGPSTATQKLLTRRKYDAALQRRKEICTQILRVVLGSHVVDNAFFRISCGNNPRGIFGATATDPMHAVEEGIIPNFVEVVIDPLPDSAKATLDSLVETLFSKSSNRSSQRSLYPRISFSGGYSSLTQLSADEKVGKLFALAIVAETPVGREILNQRCDPDFDLRKKKRARQFRGENEDVSDSDTSVEETEVPNANQVAPNLTIPTRFSKLDYDLEDDAHVQFVQEQLRLHGLDYLLPILEEMGIHHSSKAYNIVWKTTRTLIRDQTFRTEQVAIPNSEDAHFAEEWRRCADRRDHLHSNITDHPDDKFYASNPVELNTRGVDQFIEILPVANHSIDVESVDQLIELMQLLLSFHAFYKYGASLFGETGIKVIDQRIREMLSKLQSQVNRGEGTLGWCISKFHDILHMALDMLLFGASENCDTSKGEHGLKIWAKLPSRTTQLSHGAEVFITHLASRLYEQMLVNKAYSVLVPTRRPEKKPRNMLELPTFGIRRNKGDSFRVNGLLKKHRKQNIELDSRIVDWFCGNQNKLVLRNGIIVYSQLYLEEYNHLTFRATPNYLGTGPWYDWVLVSFINSKEEAVHYPFKILGFVEKDDGSPVCFGQMCAMQSVKEKKESSNGLFEHWHLEQKTNSEEPVYRFVEIDSIINPCLSFQLAALAVTYRDPSLELSKHVIVVKDRQKEWPRIFVEGPRKRKKKKKSNTPRKKRRES
jgi:hypothetical protein